MAAGDERSLVLEMTKHPRGKYDTKQAMHVMAWLLATRENVHILA